MRRELRISGFMTLVFFFFCVEGWFLKGLRSFRGFRRSKTFFLCLGFWGYGLIVVVVVAAKCK